MAAGPGGPADGVPADGRGLAPGCTSCDSAMDVLDRFLRGGS